MKTVSLRSACCTLLLFILTGIFSCKPDSPNDPTLKLLSFSPEQGSEGGAVTITGKNFSSSRENNTVKFNGLAATVSEASQDGTSITVIIPGNATTGKISVKVGDQEAVSAKDFVVNPLAPAITGFTPDKGPEGTIVVITGNNFKAPAKVFFGTLEGTDVIVASKNRIEVKAPAGLATAKIKVQCNGLEAESAASFHAPPTAGAINPKKASEGAEIEITGTNFDPVPANNTVTFGAVQAEVLSATSTKLKVKVPAGAANGKISVSVKEMVAQTTDLFYLLATITDFNPRHGEPGTTVVISGKNFDTSPSIRIGDVDCAITKQEANAITITIPNAATTPSGFIIITSKGEILKTAAEFEVTNVWRQIHAGTSMSHSEGTSFAVGGKLYLAGGYGNSDVHEFDPATRTWAKVNSFPAEIAGGRYGVTIVANNKAYIGNLFATANKRAWYEFDPSISGAAAWKRMADYPADEAYGGVGFNLNNNFYAGLGSGVSNFISRFDPAANSGNGAWGPQFVPSSWNRIYISHFSINGVGYYGGGYDGGVTGRREFYKFDPAASSTSVTPIQPFPFAIVGAPAYVLNGKGYVIASATPYEYSTSANTWTAMKYPIPVAVSFAQVVNNKAYAFTMSGQVFEYIPNR
jgi:hypothetical protein